MSKDIPTAIAMTDNCLKLVRARYVRGQGQLTALDVRHVNGDTDADLLPALREFARHKAVKGGGAYLVLPRHLAILKVIRLPSQEERELRQMAEIQISSQTPYTTDEVEYDVQVISRDEEGYTKVLLIVIPKDVTERFIELAEQARIALAGITISSIGLLGWLRYQAGRTRVEAKSPLALCNIDLNHTEICFIENKRLIFSRNVNVGLSELRSSPDELIQQIALSIKYYESEKMGGPLSRFVVVSGQRDLQEFIGQLEGQLQMPCESIAPTDGVNLPRHLRQTVLEEESGLTLTAPLGIHFADRKQVVNLLSSSIRASKQNKVLKRELIKLFVCGMLLYATALFVWSIRLSEKEKQVERLRSAVSELDPQIDEAKRKMRLIEYFDQYVDGRIFVPEVMGQLAKLVPEDISLNSLYLNERCVFTIQGYAQTREALNDFQARLVNEPMFRKVNLEFATSRRIFTMQVTDFKFTASLCDEEAP
ncbi:MAG: pilus assembly protein PilM [Candidatus Omnitrophica bacterium]|nr:pilus assembly protein PilM [Candidatus Omnitrophota bacterium]MCB9722016.1 pilus assembly protein PilM [Candidatus Omnitrophota bacterium]